MQRYRKSATIGAMGRAIAQVSARGTVTLPADVRRDLGLVEGDVLTVEIREGAVVLTPTVLTPVEIYTEARIAEFDESAKMTAEELALAREAWGLSSA
jgi:AbrB family looped-hinge helix DNA binding protein